MDHPGDAEGDGVREVHSNTIEGICTGLRNFLRPFWGVGKWFLARYAAILAWGHNIKCIDDHFLRVFLGFYAKPTAESDTRQTT